jgi:hypothetical protein
LGRADVQRCRAPWSGGAVRSDRSAKSRGLISLAVRRGRRRRGGGSVGAGPRRGPEALMCLPPAYPRGAIHAVSCVDLTSAQAWIRAAEARKAIRIEKVRGSNPLTSTASAGQADGHRPQIRGRVSIFHLSSGTRCRNGCLRGPSSALVGSWLGWLT